MLYRFRSKACADVLMLGPHAQRLLQIMGKPEAASGVLLPPDMPLAIQRLEEAAAQEVAAHREASAQAEAEGRAPPSLPEVGLRQRTAPLVQMMRLALAEDVPVIWGV